MSYFKGLKLTKLGEQLIAKANANTDEIITIKRAELGAGEISSDDEIKNLTGLKNKWQDVSIADIKVTGENETNVLIELQFNNKHLLEDKIFRELGIYASGKDGTEILFAYSNAGENYDYIPIASNNPQSFIINIFITITSDVEVNANIDLNSYVSVRKLQEELAKKQNINDGNLLTKIKTVVGAINELFKEKQNKEDTSLLTTVKNIVGAINELFSNKLEKGGYTGNAKNLNDEISKKASKTVLGRMIVGDNLTVDENGRVSGNPTYTHPTGAGNNHIPAGGSIGQVLKNSGNGVATWGDMDLGNYYTKTETDEKFKNFCPFKVGDIYLTTNSTNPSSIFLGTTWQKIEGRFLLGTSGSGVSKATGGSNSKTIAQANLPNVKLTVNSFSLSRGTMDITGAVKTTTDFGVVRGPGSCTGAFAKTGSYSNRPEGASGTGSTDFDFQASRSWTGSTNSVAPQTSALGSGSALDITPSYYTCHMWLRLT